jgi:hypothetical protein
MTQREASNGDLGEWTFPEFISFSTNLPNNQDPFFLHSLVSR